jgi:hypothetical protein
LFQVAGVLPLMDRKPMSSHRNRADPKGKIAGFLVSRAQFSPVLQQRKNLNTDVV